VQSEGSAGVTKQPKRKQYGAVPWRLNGASREILLISSRGTGRWVIPKGWPIRGLSPAETAAREAYEEAGLGGRISKKPIGSFEYGKRFDDGSVVPTRVDVFALEQMVQHPEWPEQHQRTARWFSVSEAAEAVHERAQDHHPQARLVPQYERNQDCVIAILCTISSATLDLTAFGFYPGTV